MEEAKIGAKDEWGNEQDTHAVETGGGFWQMASLTYYLDNHS